MLNYKKTTFWIIAVAVIACIVVAVCFLTNPKNEAIPSLDYKNVAHACVQLDEIEVIYVPEKDRYGDGDANFTQVSGEALARLLDNADWKQRLIPPVGANVHGSISFVLEDNYMITIEQSPRSIACIHYDGESRYYSIGEDDYNNAVALLSVSGVYEPVIGETYVSSGCLYMNPLSSYAAVNGDSGSRYLIGEDGFTIENRSTGATQVISPVSWSWQPFPWTDEEWGSQFTVGSIPNVSEVYNDIQYQPLNDGCYLLNVDGQLWLVKTHENSNMGQFIWSIYTLVPEDDASVLPVGGTDGATIFNYNGIDYDMKERNQAINALAGHYPVGKYIIVKGHAGPKNCVYSVFDIESEQFVKDITGTNLIWRNDDITTAVYSFWSEIYDYEGKCLASVDLPDESSYIKELAFSDDEAGLIVTIWNNSEDVIVIDIGGHAQTAAAP